MMPFTQHCGVVLPLLRDNIDTDAIIPSRECAPCRAPVWQLGCSHPGVT